MLFPRDGWMSEKPAPENSLSKNESYHIQIGRAEELIALSRSIRYQVFVLEQGIPEHLDDDGLDELSWHLIVSDGTTPVAAARLYSPEGIHSVMARVAVLKEYRRRGIAGRIVQSMIEFARTSGIARIEIHAHKHLEQYYKQFGFAYIREAEVVGGHQLIEMLCQIGET